MSPARPDEATPSPRVVLVRPWVDGHGGGGCCGGEVRDGICLDGLRHPHVATAATTRAVDAVGEVWRALREAVPEVDVQVVDAGNPWLTAHVLGVVRRREGWWAGLRAAARSSTAGSVLLDGRPVGDLEELGPAGVVAAVLAALPDAVPTAAPGTLPGSVPGAGRGGALRP